MLFHYYILLILSVIIIQAHGNTTRLLYLVSDDQNKAYQINERGTFTSELNKGWIFNADKQYSIKLYIKSRSSLNTTSIFFTTHKLTCHRNDSDVLFTDIISLNNENTLIYNDLVIGNVKLAFKYSKFKYYACLMVDHNGFKHQGMNNLWISIITVKSLMPIYVVIIFYFLLLCLSALFSGLNLGLMSLDLTELKLLKKIGVLKERFYALNIYPLRKRGNLLLCTLLIGNVMVNSTSTLILGSYLEGLFAAIGSTMFIVIFGEIIPQAICSRYGLAVGSYTRYITYLFMGLTFPISYPLSKLLDLVLGKQTATTYTRDKVRELMSQAKGIEDKEKKFISGALDFKNKYVKDVMMPISEVFSLDINDVLDFDTFQKIAFHGYSRIPIYEHSRENLIGMIRVQDLLLNDPADRLPLRGVVDFYKRKVAKCSISDRLDRMFEKFRQGESHMSFVYLNDPNTKIDDTNDAVGIVTLEDVIEELVQSDILDESDCKRESRKKRIKALRGKLKSNIDPEHWNIFVKQADINKPLISPQIRKALFQFLHTSVKPFTFDFISPRALDGVLRHPDFTKEKLNLTENDNDSDMYIYKYGEEFDYFVIILSGNATMEIGREKIEVKAGLFSYYGVNALITDSNQNIEDIVSTEYIFKPYIPEFSLRIEQYCVYFQISRNDWLKLVKNSNMERKYSISAIATPC